MPTFAPTAQPGTHKTVMWERLSSRDQLFLIAQLIAAGKPLPQFINLLNDPFYPEELQRNAVGNTSILQLSPGRRPIGVMALTESLK